LKHKIQAETASFSHIPHKRLIISIGVIVFTLVITFLFTGVHLEESHKPIINQLSDVELDLSLINFHSSKTITNEYNLENQNDAPSISNIIKTLNGLLVANNWDDIIFPLYSKQQEEQINNILKKLKELENYYNEKPSQNLNSHRIFFIINLIDSIKALQNGLNAKLNTQLKIIHGTQFIALAILLVYFILAYRLVNKYKKTKIALFLKQYEYIKLTRETNFFMQKSQKIAQLGYYTFDFDKKKWDISNDFLKLLGFSGSEMTYKQWVKIIFEDDKKILTDIIDRRKENTNLVLDVVYRIIRPKDGEIRWIHHFADAIELDEDYKPLPVFGILQDITEKRKLEHDYLNAFIDAQEQEKQNFGEDLHDGISQILAAEGMFIDILLQHENLDRKKVKTYLEKIKEHNLNAINDARRIAHGLMSKQLKQEGLLRAIEYICDDYNHSRDISFVFNKDGVEENEIIKTVKTNIFRICQEITTNILRHSGATKASISFSKTVTNELKLVIEDNGVGIDFERMKSENRGAGLKNIERRVTLLNGKVDIDSILSKGTKFTITVPLGASI
jgi:PAS domain S-box-containing protein